MLKNAIGFVAVMLLSSIGTAVLKTSSVVADLLVFAVVLVVVF